MKKQIVDIIHLAFEFFVKFIFTEDENTGKQGNIVNILHVFAATQTRFSPSGQVRVEIGSEKDNFL